MATILTAGQSAVVAVAAGDTWTISKTALNEGKFSVVDASGVVKDAGVFGNTALTNKSYGPYYDNSQVIIATTLTISCTTGSLSYTEVPAGGGGGSSGPGTNSVVVPVTTNQSPAAADTGKIYTNPVASGAITINLPAWALNLEYGVYVGAAQTMTLDANGTDLIKNGGDSSVAGGTLAAATVGNYVYLKATNTGVWSTQDIIGDWTLT